MTRDKLFRFVKSWGIKFIGLGIFIFILYTTNLHQLLAAIKKFSLLQICLLIILSFFVILFKSVRFRSILKINKVESNFYKTFLIYGSGIYLGTITPGRLGDFTKVLYLKNHFGCRYTKGVIINIIDRVLDLFILVLTSLLALNWLVKINTKIIILSAILIVSIIVIFFHKKMINTIIRFVERIFKTNIPELWTDHLFSLALFMPLFFSLIPYLLIYYQMIFISRILGFTINPYLLIGTLALGNITGLIPISISGLGTRDAVFILMLGKVGLTSAEAVSLSLSFFLLNNFSILIISFFLFLLLKLGRSNE